MPVQILFADALPRLRAGELDAVLSSGDCGAGARLWEVLPHFTVLDYASPLSLAFCNARALGALPEAARAAVMQAATQTEARQFRTIVSRTAENEARMGARRRYCPFSGAAGGAGASSRVSRGGLGCVGRG